MAGAGYEPSCGEPDDNPIINCWCGESGTYEELFDSDLDATCHGTGSLHCYCGGDFCVCHNHGEVPCEGCEDCEYDEETDFGEDEYDPYDQGGEIEQ